MITIRNGRSTRDGVIGGVYFCQDLQLDAYGANTNPTFEISYGWCPSQSANRWLLSFGGTLWTCKNLSSSAAVRAIGMIETTGTSTVDRNIDVKYTNLKYRYSGASTWNNFGTATSVVAPSYTYAYVSSTAFNVYLAPLD
ncbi:MAG: hypothetical protein WCE80_09105 [Acidimicrobiia bacterium]